MKRLMVALRGRGGESGAKDSWHLRLEIGDEIISNTITSVQKDSLILEHMKKRYRIRRLSTREVFRLMNVSDEDIDKIKAAGISESQQYKMAGNSIVVAVLEGIFRNMFTTEEYFHETLF